MFVSLQKVSGSEIHIPIADVRDLIASYSSSRQTGVILLSSSRGATLHLILKNGAMAAAQVISAEKNRNIDPREWETWMNDAGSAYFRYIPLTVRALQIFKLLIQTTPNESGSLTHPGELAELIRAQSAHPTLIHVERENALGAVFIKSPGDVHSLYLSPEQIYDQAGIAPHILDLAAAHPTAVLHTLDPLNDAWQEYLLRSAFDRICGQILTRLNDITGQAVVDSLIQLTITFALRQGLDIGITARKVDDNEIFPSPAIAARNYQLLLTEMLIHFTGITGSRLLASILRDITADLPPQEHNVTENFSLLRKGFTYERKL